MHRRGEVSYHRIAPGVGFLTVAMSLCLAARGAAGETASPGSGDDYLRDVKPVLAKHCYVCHGVMKRNGGLRLDTAKAIRKGGDGGPAIEPGKSAESLLVDAITGRDDWKMPPEGEGAPLSVEEIRAITAWVDRGAAAPADEQPMTDPRKHWSFRTPVRPAVPRVAGERENWIRNPIDAFLAARHEERGLTPRPPASPGVLIRRVYLDLIGLVPTPEEARAFAADPSDRAYEETVDRLLASPQYGERWARHWMDVWRYSDWDGYGAEVRESQPHIWRWRDWIVESLNADEGYDRMIVRMLAADEASPEDPGALRATGFLVRNWYKFNRNVWLDATVEHTSKAFLGLTINCAKCHDHKYDPIGQADYYRFRAIFEPHATRTDRIPGQPDIAKDGLVRVYDAEPGAKTFLFTRGDDKRPVRERPMEPGVPRVLERQATFGPIAPVALNPTAYYPGFRKFVREETLAQARAQLKAREADLAKAGVGSPRAKSAVELGHKAVEAARANLISVEARIAADMARYSQPPRADAESLSRIAAKSQRVAEKHAAEEALLRAELALADAEQAAHASKTRKDQKAAKAVADAKSKRDQARADLKAKGQALAKDDADYAPLGSVYPPSSTGRRLALARWIVDRNNPLTARVAVNHLWMRHFGTPLVPTVFDFGVNGKPPANPALLDWLAVELMDSGWRMKAIHRLIVTSSAYRMRSSSAGPADPNLATDPTNQDYWRMNPRRMEAEAVRDNLLRVAGNLDASLGGPDLDPESGLTSPRRSLYFRHAKEKRVTFLRLFDSSDVQSCYRRSESVVPQQALALANSPLSFAQARRLAGTLSAPRADDPTFVAAAFQRVLSREPTAEERSECLTFLAEQSRQLTARSTLTPFPPGPAAAVAPSSDPAQRARESLVHVLMNHNDFVTIR